MNYDALHLVLEFLSFLLALGIAGFGVVKFINKKFEDAEEKINTRFSSVFSRMDATKKEATETYVRQDVHNKVVEFLEKNTDQKIQGLQANLALELKFINEKLNTLIQHGEKTG